MDFLTLLEESFSTEQPGRGDIVTGVILSIDNLGMLVDIGTKRDGVVPRSDLEKLGEDVTFKLGDEVPVMIVRSEDEDGNMIVSISQAKQNEDWLNAEQMLTTEDIVDGFVADANRGGLIVPFGNLRGFIPASHVIDLPRGLNEEERRAHLMSMIGQKISVKVIEVNRRRRRLVLSQREAQREIRDASKDALLGELHEGEVRRGRVSGLRDFGAFVDLGGADGLIHISELAWHRVKHPRELLNVGDEIDVYVLRLDQEGRRIGLSLKRLQPNPWSQVDELYHVGQVVEGVVSRVTQFGAFVSLDPGIEALLHASQIADPTPENPAEILREGDTISARIISIESHRQRLGLSIRDVENNLPTLEASEGETFDAPQDEIDAGQSEAYTVQSDELEPVAEEEPVAE
ncbi:MAG TPA: S1 RNA-binding domain-containing protein [Aggregatilinea sp.]|uniref:30S ribosomal protein S1 n=1 Tax=Aggregatilinea sp. TaxID=2806333 RepID=UPI002C491415|nr:S1 RNA-binding domain-containing protein [Aggregatilinea sp.]HML24193.1 S1 RNA-binding domain-containing protein [Aggregatilinea sp.]